MAFIYGNPAVKIETDVVDRIGLRTLVLSKMWAPSRDDLTQEEIDAEAPEVPPVPGGVLLIGEQTRQASGGLRTTWTFEGIKGNGKTVTFKGRNDSLDYSFEPGFTQASIRLHPQFHELLQKYGGESDNDGNVVWPPDLPDSAVSTNGLGSKSLFQDGRSSSAMKNPMFGIEEFFRMEGSYRFRYIATQLPQDLKARVGHAVPTSALPGTPPYYKDRNWLKLPVPWKRRGFIYEIVEMYWLSGEGGWPAPIYNLNSNMSSGSGDRPL